MDRAVIPGGGWLATYTLEDGTTITDPVVGWVIDVVTGTGGPLLTDRWGRVVRVANSEGRFWHPDQTKSDGDGFLVNRWTDRSGNPVHPGSDEVDPGSGPN